MFLARHLVMAVLMLPASARGQSSTPDALDRLEEVLEMRLEEGQLRRKEILPAILVSAAARYEESERWFPTRATALLTRVLGNSGLRLCEACMVPRMFVHQGRLERSSGPISLDEIVRLDEQARGQSRAAHTALWLDETREGVSLRIVDLRTARVVFAQNIDPELQENADSEKRFALSRELERRARGDSITQAFVDFTVYPGQHFSLDWTDQWGETNANLSGVVLSLYDPVVGFGGAYYRCFDFLNALVGVKVIMSVPTALIRTFDEDSPDVIDPLVTGVAVVRIPFGASNYGLLLTASTNGKFGIGLSLLNISLLPVLP